MGDKKQCGEQGDQVVRGKWRCAFRMPLGEAFSFRCPGCRAAPSEERGSQRQPNQRVDQAGAKQVHREVEDVVADDLQSPQPVVHSDGQVAYEAARVVEIAGTVEECAEIPDDGIFGDGGFIIKEKRDLKGIGIGEQADRHDKQELSRRSSKVIHNAATSLASTIPGRSPSMKKTPPLSRRGQLQLNSLI